MTTTYGLTSTGFVVKPFEVIRAELITAVQGAFGASVDVSDGSFLGQWIGIVAERESNLWDLAQAVDASDDPDAATGVQLEGVCAITGTFRADATPSSVALILTGTPNTAVSSTAQIAATSTGNLFKLTAAATIGALTAWVGTTAYNVGDRRTNGGNAYQCITAGTSASSGGPTTLLADITDGTVHWTYLGVGTGATDAAALSVLDGPIVGASRDITQIRTPVGGWSGVINLLDAVLGALEQADESLRTLRDAELSQSGVADPDAIRAAILKVGIGTGNPVTSCTVFANNTDVATGNATNNNILPPHSVEAVVIGGADQDVLNALYGTVAGGIAFAANTTVVSGTVIDSSGNAQPVRFTRPQQLPIYVDITYTKDPNQYPSDGDAQVKNTIVAYGQRQLTGKDAVASSIAACIFPVYVNGVLVSGVAGVLDVTQTFIGLAPSPVSSATIFISDHQQAVHDTSRITVHTSNGTP